MVFSVVYEFRDKLALEEHGVQYLELGPDLQKKVRQAYPMVPRGLVRQLTGGHFYEQAGLQPGPSGIT